MMNLLKPKKFKTALLLGLLGWSKESLTANTQKAMVENTGKLDLVAPKKVYLPRKGKKAADSIGRLFF